MRQEGLLSQATGIQFPEQAMEYSHLYISMERQPELLPTSGLDNDLAAQVLYDPWFL